MTTPRAFDETRLKPLAGWLKATLAAAAVTIRSAERLSGGAVQENWRLDVEVTGGPRAGSHTWVLRTDATARLSLSLDRAAEYDVLVAAHRAGVPVAEPIVRCADPDVVGRPFLVQSFVAGIAQGRRIVRDPAVQVHGPGLAADLGRALARIHALTPSTTELSVLPLPLRPAAKAEAQRLRLALDGAGEPRPALEYILTWLDTHAPERQPLVLVHGDYRTGNYLVADGHVAAILDWEFAHWGDRHEDVGWLCARCWRFGADDREVGGIAQRADLYDAYDTASDEPLDRSAVAYWEVYALAKWAAIAVLQGDRYRKGGEASLELALTGLMPPEMEFDALDLIGRIERDGGLPWL